MSPRLFLLFLACISIARAQDPFEIQVYEYEPMPRGSYSIEGHFNYVAKGTKSFDGTVAPTNDQFHMTYEFTAGITQEAALGVMLLTARRPGGTLQYAGWRILPHFYAPRSWHLPVDLGLISEFSFQDTRFEENSRRLEIRPIVAKELGHFQIAVNPVFERALHGPGVANGWGFEPALRIGYEAGERFTPSLEYYGSTGSVPTTLALDKQEHQIFPGGDIVLRENLLWNVGVGIGLTSAGDRVIFKSRLEYSFGGKKRTDRGNINIFKHSTLLARKHTQQID